MSDIRKVSVEFFRLGNQVRIADRILMEASVNSEVIMTHAIEGLCLGIQTWLLKSPHPAKQVTLYAPADWWEHFKERWFPQWAKDKWPVLYGIPTQYEYGPIYVCPHSTEKWRDNKSAHFLWLDNGPKQGLEVSK